MKSTLCINEKIISEFKVLLGIEWEPNIDQKKVLKELSTYAFREKCTKIRPFKEVFIESVNRKLELNAFTFQTILDYAFRNRVKFNYYQKLRIRELLDSGNVNEFNNFLIQNKIDNLSFQNYFKPLTETETFIQLNKAIVSDKNYKSIIASIFSRYCFNLFDQHITKSFFSGCKDAKTDYFDFLTSKYADICMRNHAMAFVDVPPFLIEQNYKQGCNTILNTIKNIYNSLNNHCIMIVYIPFLKNAKGSQWKLYSDIILFAEKHIKERIDKAYFQWKKIGDITKKYIESITPYNAEFDIAFQGFTFKDCFIIGENYEYDLMLIFEKNKRDERVINCPACYSKVVQGNSYPILNVKSWECKNPLCPDRSKYNRGKRYSFVSLFRQNQMLEDENKIPEQSIAKWHLDCVNKYSKKEILEMAIRHYSCVGDTIDVYTQDLMNEENLQNRLIHYRNFEPIDKNLLHLFKDSSYFYRYLQDNLSHNCNIQKNVVGKAELYFGDSFDVLKTFKSESIDGAVTSPPYYNAKTYSQWGNIYCYLYDMYNISNEIYRVMKSGAIYLFNIFDYFDNENNVSLSAMGNKRMILGAYMIDIFERIGFDIVGNIIWNKGEIQGNRSFNQGNLTPYYQAPLNCWEHILIVSKGNLNKKYSKIMSQIKNIRPVVKMIKGKNIIGHEAPYPLDIPEILINHMNKNDIVLDPFVGSGTTSILANRYGIKSIGIEKNYNYYNLCKERVSEDINSNQLSLV